MTSDYFILSYMKISKKQINKAGEIIRNGTDNKKEQTIDLLNQWRSNHMLPLRNIRAIVDSRHLEKIYHMPVKFLTRTESSFFSVDESSVLHLAPQLAQFTADSAFAAHYRDIISYRCADYYRRRYEGKKITAQSSPVHLQKEPEPE